MNMCRLINILNVKNNNFFIKKVYIKKEEKTKKQLQKIKIKKQIVINKLSVK
jgi:hypothetical protein